VARYGTFVARRAARLLVWKEFSALTSTFVAPPAGLEPATRCLEGSRSIRAELQGQNCIPFFSGFGTSTGPKPEKSDDTGRRPATRGELRSLLLAGVA